MDVDAYVAAHRHQWRRLEELVGRRPKDSAEADEILDLYQRVSTHLSRIRSTAPDPTLVAYLSMLLSKARTRATGTRNGSWRQLLVFFTSTFPGMLYRSRRWWLVTTAVNVVVAFAVGAWFLAHPTIEQSLLTPAEVDQLVNSDFENYYSEYAASSFAFRVWTNNAWVSALAITLGVFGFPVVMLLWSNVLNVAIIGSIMWRAGRGDLFFGLILPHGLLELTCVFVAGGVGLRVFWSWVEPGARTRMTAVAEEFRASITVALGLIVVLFISGVIEAFVTPSPLPTWARIAIGILALAAFYLYVWTFGRRAYRAGVTGDVSAIDRGASTPVSA